MMYIYKRSLVLVLALVFLLSVSACGAGDEAPKDPPQDASTLFDGAEIWGVGMRLTVVKENSSGEYVLNSQSTMERKAVLDALRAVKAVHAPDWTSDEIGFPLYAFTCGQECEYLWSNGYLITDDGHAYRFDFDFGALLKEHFPVRPNGDGVQLSRLPAYGVISRDEDGWRKEFMTAASGRPMQQQQDVSIRLIGWQNDSAVIELGNHSGEEWLYGRGYSLDVLIDGAWYSVPGNGFSVAADATGLPAGTYREVTISLERYGDLPSGTYRLSFNGLSVEHKIK